MYFVQQSLNTVSYLFLTKEGSPLVPEIDENEISQNKQGALTPLSIHLAILVSMDFASCGIRTHVLFSWPETLILIVT